MMEYRDGGKDRRFNGQMQLLTALLLIFMIALVLIALIALKGVM